MILGRLNALGAAIGDRLPAIDMKRVAGLGLTVAGGALTVVGAAGLADTLDVANMPAATAGLESAYRSTLSNGFAWVDGATSAASLPYAIWAKPAALLGSAVLALGAGVFMLRGDRNVAPAPLSAEFGIDRELIARVLDRA